jgi:hypothetical protein
MLRAIARFMGRIEYFLISSGSTFIIMISLNRNANLWLRVEILLVGFMMIGCGFNLMKNRARKNSNV